MSNTNTEVLTTAYEKLQGAITQSNTVLPKLEEAVKNADLSNYATVSQLEEKANLSNSPNIKNLSEIYKSDTREWGKKITEGISNNRVVTLNNGAHVVDTSILYSTETFLKGNAWTNYGTKLRSSGDFPILTYNPNVTNRIRNYFCDVLFDGVNLIDSYAVEINRMYLSTFERCYFLNGANFKIEDSDSIRFIDCKFMDSKKDINLTIGAGSRSIHFIGCNFENNQGLYCNVNINGDNAGQYTLTTNINFTNCQAERAKFTFDRVSNCTIDCSKFHRTKIVLGQYTNNCRIINVADANTTIIDLGVNNAIEGCVGANIAGFNIFKRNLKSDFSYVGGDKYGDLSKEYLFITSIYPESKGKINECAINYKYSNDTDIKTVEIDNYLNTDSSTQGSGIRQSYTDFNVFKTTDTYNIKVTSSASKSITKRVILKENKLINGSFKTINNWTTQNCSIEIENNKLKITITNNGAWSVYQQLNGLNPTSNYMGLCKLNSKISICIGKAHDGTLGDRKCIGDVYNYEDGNYITQLFFTDFYKPFVSLGSLSGTSGNVIYVEWIAVVELD